MSVKLGTPVCLLCDLVYSKKTNKFVLNHVRYVSSSFKDLYSKAIGDSILYNALYFFFLASSAYFAIKFLNRAVRFCQIFLDSSVRAEYEESRAR